MLLKHETASVPENPMQTHPIVSRLATLNKLLEKLDVISDRNDGKLRDQMQLVVKAAESLKNPTQATQDGGTDTESDQEATSNTKDGDASDDEVARKDSENDDIVSVAASTGSSSDSSALSDAISKSVLDEARFGLRPGEFNVTTESETKVIRDVDVGDTPHDGGMIMKRLASTVNSINQRTETKRGRKIAEGEDIDDFEAMASNYDGGYAEQDEEIAPLRRPAPEMDNAESLDEFYSKAADASKKRKKAKQDIYGAKPKFPRIESEIAGERAVRRQILKNRGLVAHKNKLNRNPRVKKREKYRRALIQRHGAVREVRTNEAHRYAGEQTGIKTSISRSRKLA